jgi:hypothetical protein
MNYLIFVWNAPHQNDELNAMMDAAAMDQRRGGR